MAAFPSDYIHIYIYWTVINEKLAEQTCRYTYTVLHTLRHTIFQSKYYTKLGARTRAVLTRLPKIMGLKVPTPATQLFLHFIEFHIMYYADEFFFYYGFVPVRGHKAEECGKLKNSTCGPFSIPREKTPKSWIFPMLLSNHFVLLKTMA